MLSGSVKVPASCSLKKKKSYIFQDPEKAPQEVAKSSLTQTELAQDANSFTYWSAEGFALLIVDFIKIFFYKSLAKLLECGCVTQSKLNVLSYSKPVEFKIAAQSHQSSFFFAQNNI